MKTYFTKEAFMDRLRSRLNCGVLTKTICTHVEHILDHTPEDPPGQLGDAAKLVIRESGPLHWNYHGRCPTCDLEIDEDWETHFCPNCGQRLKWSDR